MCVGELEGVLVGVEVGVVVGVSVGVVVGVFVGVGVESDQFVLLPESIELLALIDETAVLLLSFTST